MASSGPPKALNITPVCSCIMFKGVPKAVECLWRTQGCLMWLRRLQVSRGGAAVLGGCSLLRSQPTAASGSGIQLIALMRHCLFCDAFSSARQSGCQNIYLVLLGKRKEKISEKQQSYASFLLKFVMSFLPTVML